MTTLGEIMRKVYGDDPKHFYLFGVKGDRLVMCGLFASPGDARKASASLEGDLELRDFSDLFANTEFNVFKSALASGGRIRGFAIPGGAAFARRRIDELTELAKSGGARGLVPLSRTRSPGARAGGVAGAVALVQAARPA